MLWGSNGISTNGPDVSCQVAYSHAQVGIGNLGVSISSTGAISFSCPITMTKQDYFGRAFTLHYDTDYK